MCHAMIILTSLLTLFFVSPLQAASLWSEQHQLPLPQKPLVGSASAERGLCIAGNRVEILSGGKWYVGNVLKEADTSGTCLVSYDGYGSNWDEWVNLSRLRLPVAETVQKKQPDAAQAMQSGKLPAGSYACYTFDAGQMNYTYTDIIIKSATRYAVGNAEGNYEVRSPASVIFKSGPLQETDGSYAYKNNGTVEIKLVFYNDARASMVCSRSGNR